MHEADANERVRELCRQILDEKDPERVEELIATLKSSLRAENEEVRLRMKFLARHYRGRLQGVSPEAEQISQGSGRIRAVLDFLGFGAGMRLGGELEG
jgi:hypothetical protein